MDYIQYTPIETVDVHTSHIEGQILSTVITHEIFPVAVQSNGSGSEFAGKLDGAVLGHHGSVSVPHNAVVKTKHVAFCHVDVVAEVINRHLSGQMATFYSFIRPITAHFKE